MKKIIKWIKNLFWWRFYYIKTRITTEEANIGRCIICHAGIRVNPNDKSQPICSEHNCPCKWNERLIINERLIK